MKKSRFKETQIVSILKRYENGEKLLELGEKWGEKYPIVIDSWQNNWEKLSTYFACTAPIRNLIYTTNTVEGYHRQIRKITIYTGTIIMRKMIICI